MTQPRFKVKRGDFVEVTTGKDKGKRGVIFKVDLEEARVYISGLGEYVRHIRPSQAHPEGQVKKQRPYHISNVALVDPSTNVTSRVGYRFDDGKKVRFFKESKNVVIDHMVVAGAKK